MTEAPTGVLRWIERLHPGWMAVPVVGAFVLNAVGYYLAEAVSGVGEVGSLLASIPTTALAYAYAFLVAALVCGRFHSRKRRRLGRYRIAFMAMLAGLFGMPFFVGLGGALGQDITVEGGWSEKGMIASWAVFVACGFYVMISASVDLVEAERGFGGGTGRKIGTFVLFFFWVIGVFFIQARVRRLAQKFAAADVLQLPMEKLELQELESGRLALVLTERVGGDAFEAYGKELIQRLDGHVLKQSGLPDGSNWKVEIEGSEFRLLSDPRAMRISLEGCDDSADLLLVKLQKWLAPPGAA